MNYLNSSNLYYKDIQRLIENFPDIKLLKDKVFLITGCNGLICSTIVDLLIVANKRLDLNLKLYLATRDIEKSKNRFGNENVFIQFLKYDARKPFICETKIDYFIHGASPASPDLFVTQPVDTFISNIFGLKEVLDNSLKYKSKTIFISSSEVYGKLQNNDPIKEDACGYIDFFNTRSSYGQSKRAAENLCVSYISQYNANIIIARPGHIYGPTASRADKRISSLFMYDAFEGKNLILKSKGEQIRSYTYCMDCASAIIYILLHGKNGEAYNISNQNSICSIAEMANQFATISNVKLLYEIPEEDEKRIFNPMNNSSLDSTKLEALGWKSSFSKEEGFDHSIKILRELYQK